MCLLRPQHFHVPPCTPCVICWENDKLKAFPTLRLGQPYNPEFPSPDQTQESFLGEHSLESREPTRLFSLCRKSSFQSLAFLLAAAVLLSIQDVVSGHFSPDAKISSGCKRNKGSGLCLPGGRGSVWSLVCWVPAEVGSQDVCQGCSADFADAQSRQYCFYFSFPQGGQE